MDTTHLAYFSAREVATAIRERKLRSREVLEAMLERIEKHNPALNAVVTLEAERARSEADRADAEARKGEFRGPLHGVCMTIKDSFMTAGMRTTSGAPELSDFVPETDAVPVARLRAAGAIVVGKTNLPIYAGDAQSYNEVFGRSNNPWNVGRTPGGSSGGSAAALAAGLTPIELGSDIGGSIRGPASACGVTGHKPSYGVIPAIGQIPGPPGTLTQADLAVAGPMARNIDDLELGLALMAGADDWYAPGWRLTLPPPRHRSLREFRVAVWVHEDLVPIEREVEGLLLEAADALKREGVRIDYDARPDFTFEYAVGVYDQLLGAALSGGFTRGEIEALATKADAADESHALGARHASPRHRERLPANERRLQLRRKWREFVQDWDAVLFPCLPTTAIPHDPSQPIGRRKIVVNGEERPYNDQLRWMGPAGVAYLPATVVPVGLSSEGLPVGAQLAGPFLEDRTTLALGRHLEAIHGGFQRPPGY
jgi:amidase